MMRVELAGPPGAGKTTLLRHLVQTLPDAITARQLPLLAHLEAKGPRRLTRWAYQYQAGERWMRHRFEKAMVRAELRRLRDADDEWSTFLSNTTLAFAGAEALPALTLERLQSFIRQVAAVHFAERLTDTRIVLFDEGLVQRAISLGEGVSDPAVRAYVASMPLPSATILLDATADCIHARLRCRSANVDRFHAMVDRSLKTTQAVFEGLERRAANVFILPADQPPDLLVAQIAANDKITFI